MLGAALLARSSKSKDVRPWVKATVLGSQVVSDYYDRSAVVYLEELGFYLVGYGATPASATPGRCEESQKRLTTTTFPVTAVLSDGAELRAGYQQT